MQGVAAQFPGRVALVSENFGESELAERFGVKRYPAVFIDDVLVAKPKDFGFFGASGSQGSGRYTPWLDEGSRERFRVDMQRLVGKALEGRLSSADGVAAGGEGGLERMPAFELTDLHGLTVNSEDLRGSVTLIDFWASWCPPCLTAMPWLAELQEQHAEDLRVVGIAVESRPEEVSRIVQRFDLPFPVALGPPELASEFGDLVVVPTAFLFDRDGKLVRTFFGSPPELKQELKTLIEELASAERKGAR